MTAAIARPPKGLYSEEEWAIRCDLAALYRLVAHFRMTDLIYTHISARLPGPEHRFLINQYGVLFHEMRASDLVVIDLDGNIVDQPNRETRLVNPAGFTIHSAIHANREDANCVIHLHSTDGVAVSSQEQGLLAIDQHAMSIVADLAYHDYEGIALDLDERERLVHDIGQHNLMLLRNHGTLTCGRTCADAFLRMYYLERSCSMQVRALAGGAKVNATNQGVPEKVAGQIEEGFDGPIGQLAWPALLRLLDRKDPSYKH